MEPINVVLIGSEATVLKAFAEAGWEPSDRLSLGSLWRLVAAELRNLPPPRATGLPTFWNAVPNPKAFQRVNANGSPRERHHLHLWNTSFRINGEPAWVGTVHFDKQVHTGGGVGLLIHEIDPAVDREREALGVDLSRSTCVGRLWEAEVTAPMLGRNAVGNPFFTDGKAIVVDLKCLSAQ